MRTPSNPSMMRPSTWEITRTEPMNSNANGIPMMRMIRPAVSDMPVTAQVK